MTFVKEHLDWFNRYYTLQGIDEKYDDYLDGKERTEEDDKIYNLFEYSPNKDTLLITFSTDGAVVSFDEAFKCPYDICAQVAYIRYIAGKSGMQEGREAFIKSLLDMSDFDYVVEKKMVLEMAVDLLNRNEIANILNAWGCGKILPAEITADWLLEQFDLYSY